jgi:hypothetical protein
MASNLFRNPVHLGPGARVLRQPEFTDMNWYAAYEKRHGGDGVEGRLVSMYTFEEPWDSWEMHPRGSELVLCTAGEITLVQEIGGRQVRTKLAVGDYAINEPGVWHTADVDRPATAVFITSGLGTEHRKR